MSRLVSFGVLVAILVVIGVIFYQVMATFILPLFLATLLVVIFHPLHRWILGRTGNRHYVAALLTTIAVFAIVLLPGISVTTFAIIEASSAVTQINVGTIRDRLEGTRSSLGLEVPFADDWRQLETSLSTALLGNRENGAPPATVSSRAAAQFGALTRRLDDSNVEFNREHSAKVRELLEAIPKETPGTIEYDSAVQSALVELRDFKVEMLGGPPWSNLKEIVNPSDDQLRLLLRDQLVKWQEWLFSIAGDTTAFLGKALIGLLIMMAATFFFFADGPKMMEHVMQLTPLDPTYERELLLEFDKVSRAVVIATLLSAIVQGALAGIGYFFAGLQSVFLLMLLTTFMSMVPIVGAWSVWFPASLWLYVYEDRPVAALLLALYGAIIVSQIDNVIKPWVLHGQSRIHPLAALLSVLGGVQALGPIGILVGPMVVAFLGTLLKILQRELAKLEKTPWATEKK